jgi:ABC-type antimicrobial peptide transport system permease subunit
MPEKMFSFWLIIVFVILFILFGVLAGLERKKTLGGYMSFKEGLQAVFLAFVIGSLITTIYSYILYNFLDPTLPDQLKHYSLETTESWMRKFKAPQDQIDEQLDKVAAQDFSMTLGKTVLNYLQGLIFYFVVAAIISLIIRKKRPITGNV